MDLFDIIKSFTNKKEWEKVSKADRQRNLFMINRIMAIQFPLQANAFNNTKIDPESVVNFWQVLISTKYKTPPTFIYTSTNKKKKEVKKEVDENVALFIKDKYEISDREISDLQRFFPTEFEKFCKDVKDVIG